MFFYTLYIGPKQGHNKDNKNIYFSLGLNGPNVYFNEKGEKDFKFRQ